MIEHWNLRTYLREEEERKLSPTKNYFPFFCFSQAKAQGERKPLSGKKKVKESPWTNPWVNSRKIAHNLFF
jgi:hypothetical protein